MSGAAPRLCPHCSVALREVSARARSGYLLALDQCEKCGGIWCDRWELFPLSASEAARLDPVDDRQLLSSTPAPQAVGRCPRCEIPLRLFRDPLLPAEARIERCAVCEGMWLNRGELHRVKQRAASIEKPHAADVDEIARAYGDAAQWSKVDDITPAMFPADDAGEEDRPLRSGAWSATAWLILRSLLQLLLRA